MRARIVDVARLASVGTTTVDRVLNERGSVSIDTTRRVLQAAQKLGLRRGLPKPHRPLARLCFLLPPPQSEFRRRLANSILEMRAIVDRSIVIQVDFVDPLDVAQVAHRLRGASAQAIAVCAVRGKAVEAAIAAARRRGSHVYTIVGDHPESEREGFFGIDNYAAARTAVMLVSGVVAREGKAQVLATAIDGASMSQRIAGFTDAIAAYLPRVRLEEPLVTGDDPERVRDLLDRALRRSADTVLVYNCGAGNSAVNDVLVSRDPDNRIRYIGHELTPNSRAMLCADRMYLAVDQNPEMMARRAVEVMMAACGYNDQGNRAMAVSPAFVPFSIHTRENPERIPIAALA